MELIKINEYGLLTHAGNYGTLVYGTLVYHGFYNSSNSYLGYFYQDKQKGFWLREF